MTQYKSVFVLRGEEEEEEGGVKKGFKSSEGQCFSKFLTSPGLLS